MAIRRIRLLGDPVLKTVSVTAVDALAALPVLRDLRDTLHEFQRTHGFGRGISAVQIGECLRLIYMEFEGREYWLINPEYEWRSVETFALWDDCFSFPDILVWLERAKTVTIRYLDQHGQPQSLTASDALSELIQHEMDHLDGILALDHANGENRICLREEWKRRYANGGDAPQRSLIASNGV